jgi:hypothetical protein
MEHAEGLHDPAEQPIDLFMCLATAGLPKPVLIFVAHHVLLD